MNLVLIGLLRDEFFGLNVVEVVVAQGGVVDFEAEAFGFRSVYLVDGGGVGVVLQPVLDLVLIGGREVGQDVVGVGFTVFALVDVGIHIPAILKQSIGHRVSYPRKKIGNFLTTEKERQDTEEDGKFLTADGNGLGTDWEGKDFNHKERRELKDGSESYGSS